MRVGRLGRAISMGVMLGAVLCLAACPGDLEEAAKEATKEDNAQSGQTLEECLEGCEQTAAKQEEDCVAQLSEEEKVDPTAFDSPVLACRNDARGDLTGCQVECNMAARQQR